MLVVLGRCQPMGFGFTNGASGMAYDLVYLDFKDIRLSAFSAHIVFFLSILMQ